VTSKVLKCSGAYPTLYFLVRTIPLIEDKDTNLNKGYRVDEKDNDGGTPLHFVISDPLHLQHMQSRARSIET
jgi:hypothetical protein